MRPKDIRKMLKDLTKILNQSTEIGKEFGFRAVSHNHYQYH